MLSIWYLVHLFSIVISLSNSDQKFLLSIWNSSVSNVWFQILCPHISFSMWILSVQADLSKPETIPATLVGIHTVIDCATGRPEEPIKTVSIFTSSLVLYLLKIKDINWLHDKNFSISSITWSCAWGLKFYFDRAFWSGWKQKHFGNVSTVLQNYLEMFRSIYWYPSQHTKA